MKHPLLVSVWFVLASLSVPAVVDADRCGIADCTEYPVLWEHDNYRGECLKLPVSRPGFKNYDFNDEASSVCVPDGWKVVLYRDTNFEGESLTVYGPASISDLKRNRPDAKNWGDKISSAEVFAPRND